MERCSPLLLTTIALQRSTHCFKVMYCPFSAHQTVICGAHLCEGVPPSTPRAAVCESSCADLGSYGESACCLLHFDPDDKRFE